MKEKIKNMLSISKKSQLIIVLGAFSIFTVIFTVDIFSLFHSKASNFIHLIQYFWVFTVLFVFVYSFIFFLWKRPISWVMYILLPILLSALGWNVTILLNNIPNMALTSSQVFYYHALFPYIPITWTLSILMVILHFVFKIRQSKT